MFRSRVLGTTGFKLNSPPAYNKKVQYSTTTAYVKEETVKRETPELTRQKDGDRFHPQQEEQFPTRHKGRFKHSSSWPKGLSKGRRHHF
ncbi:unnamed protein product [Phytomonas sp. EM1]|nr:unnamed protein product [Phytomonas sp. EM1]|eukprot:CCW64746.1 unnamed protein product [Phytomonas sp. isolate EM1]